MEKKIGFWGVPNPHIIKDLQLQYPKSEWLDLDIDFGHPETNILPDAYCKIVKNIINNSIALRKELTTIVAPIGKDKCDSGWFAAKVLKDLGFDVIESIFEDISTRREPLISTSNLPLFDKVNLIMNNIISSSALKCTLSEGIQPHAGESGSVTPIKPEFGFWGVPPNDLEILKLFPDNTHVYGWTRCAEMGVPADIDLEMYVEDDVPTVFYSQAFCSKCQLAKYLADKHNGLYIDIDDVASNSVKAKIEAFLRLR